MDKTVLEELVEKLNNRYGSGRHFEVIYADKNGEDIWVLKVKEIKGETKACVEE